MLRLFLNYFIFVHCREAIALAKVRLTSSDPVLLDTYSSWARKLENEYSYELAAKWYAGVHHPVEPEVTIFVAL